MGFLPQLGPARLSAGAGLFLWLGVGRTPIERLMNYQEGSARRTGTNPLNLL